MAKLGSAMFVRIRRLRWVRAGLLKARREGKRLGRPPTIKDALKQRIVAALKAPGRTEGVRKIAKRFGVNASTVQAISREIAVG